MVDLLTFAEFRKANFARRNQTWGPLADVPPSELGNDLAGEVGEACNKVKKIRRGDKIPIDELAKELGDVIAYTDLLAARHGIDLGRAVRSKFNEVSDRVGSDIKLKPSPLSDLQKTIAAVAERDHHLKLMRLLLDRSRKAFEWLRRNIADHDSIKQALYDINANDGLPGCVTCQHLGELCGPHVRRAKGEKVEVDADPPDRGPLCMEEKCGDYRVWLETQLFDLQGKLRKVATS